MEISSSLISALAPDTSVLSDGQKLAKSSSFTDLHKDKDNTIIFGKCKGSGKNPYSVSVDFINVDSPVARCSCPSRKIPCKHAIGLMQTYVLGHTFTEAEVPDDILSKREKQQKRIEKATEKKESGAVKPKKVNKAAALKKINNQVEGLELAEKVVYSIMKGGFAMVDRNKLSDLNKQAKQMGDYYLPGVQNAFWELIDIFSSSMDKEDIYDAAYEQIIKLNSLIKKGMDYLKERAEDPELAKNTDSEIEALLGHAWKLTELAEAGLMEQNAKLVQLTFTSHSNTSAKRWEDVGIWVNLKDGEIYQTVTYRPFAAKAYINQEDSIQGVLSTAELYKYPGKLNPRVRWDSFTLADLSKGDCKEIVAHANSDFASIIKMLKDQLKNPLSDKNPFLLVKYSKIGTIGDKFVLEDGKGERIELMDAKQGSWIDTLSTLKLLGKKVNDFNTCLLRFKYLPKEGRIAASPFALVNDEELIKLGF